VDGNKLTQLWNGYLAWIWFLAVVSGVKVGGRGLGVVLASSSSTLLKIGVALTALTALEALTHATSNGCAWPSTDVKSS
jgi:hypothetical protein